MEKIETEAVDMFYLLPINTTFTTSTWDLAASAHAAAATMISNHWITWNNRA